MWHAPKFSGGTGKIDRSIPGACRDEGIAVAPGLPLLRYPVSTNCLLGLSCFEGSYVASLDVFRRGGSISQASGVKAPGETARPRPRAVSRSPRSQATRSVGSTRRRRRSSRRGPQSYLSCSWEVPEPRSETRRKESDLSRGRSEQACGGARRRRRPRRWRRRL
jgi:hypothetical protein